MQTSVHDSAQDQYAVIVIICITDTWEKPAVMSLKASFGFKYRHLCTFHFLLKFNNPLKNRDFQDGMVLFKIEMFKKKKKTVQDFFFSCLFLECAVWNIFCNKYKWHICCHIYVNTMKCHEILELLWRNTDLQSRRCVEALSVSKQT